MSNLYCVLKIKDKQYFVTEGDIVKTHPITIEEPIQILLLRDNAETYLGDPVVENGGVEISVIGVNRIKTDVRRYKSKSRYRKNKSHSQEFSILKIIKIGSKLKGVNITVIKEDEETKEVLVKKTAEKEVKEVKEVKVDTLGFSTRIITALTKNKINTVSQLADLSKDQIIALDGLGKKSAEEILNKLGK